MPCYKMMIFRGLLLILNLKVVVVVVIDALGLRLKV